MNDENKEYSKIRRRAVWKTVAVWGAASAWITAFCLLLSVNERAAKIFLLSSFAVLVFVVIVIAALCTYEIFKDNGLEDLRRCAHEEHRDN